MGLGAGTLLPIVTGLLGRANDARWVAGLPGHSCDETCQTVLASDGVTPLSCNPEPMRAVQDRFTISAVARSTDIRDNFTADIQSDESLTAPFARPVGVSNVAEIPQSGSACNATIAASSGIRRFCFCQRAPTAESIRWTLAATGTSCVAGCQALNGPHRTWSCNANLMSAVTTGDRASGVLAALGSNITATRISSGRGRPHVVGTTLLMSTAVASDCTSVFLTALPPVQRVCACQPEFGARDVRVVTLGTVPAVPDRGWHGLALAGDKLYTNPNRFGKVLVTDVGTGATSPLNVSTSANRLQWTSPVHAPTTNKIYSVPRHNAEIFVLDPATNVTGTLSTNVRLTTSSTDALNPSYFSAWVFVPETGQLYAAPESASVALKFNPANNRSVTLTAPSGELKYLCIAYVPLVGRLYSAPARHNTVFVIDYTAGTTQELTTGLSLTTTVKYSSITFSPVTNKLYSPPASTTLNDMLVVDPLTSTVSTVTRSIRGAWIGIGLLGETNKLYATPFDANGFLEIDPSTNATSRVGTTLAQFQWSGSMYVPSLNALCVAPRDGPSTSVMAVLCVQPHTTSDAPTAAPTAAPSTPSPSATPTATPTFTPTAGSAGVVTAFPTAASAVNPAVTASPTFAPTFAPTLAPSAGQVVASGGSSDDSVGVIIAVVVLVLLVVLLIAVVMQRRGQRSPKPKASPAAPKGKPPPSVGYLEPVVMNPAAAAQYADVSEKKETPAAAASLPSRAKGSAPQVALDEDAYVANDMVVSGMSANGGFGADYAVPNGADYVVPTPAAAEKSKVGTDYREPPSKGGGAESAPEYALFRSNTGSTSAEYEYSNTEDTEATEAGFGFYEYAETT
eukprot:m.7875 g.7875  ORF g.7875 m.7875 type:complete len:851 (+) comp3998_c0_seq1:61-2613(+)